MRYGLSLSVIRETVADYRSLPRQVMEIKPQWLLEGMFSLPSLSGPSSNGGRSIVAPHYFKPADLEQLAKGDKKMPKVIGASSSAVS
jgi:pre-mRNA-splicing factor ATP-dependent RNA helicase DHX16